MIRMRLRLLRRRHNVCSLLITFFHRDNRNGDVGLYAAKECTKEELCAMLYHFLRQDEDMVEPFREALKLYDNNHHGTDDSTNTF